MLLSLRTPCRNRTTAGEAAARRWVKRAEGVSLWLAMLLMLFVHPLYAEASETEDAGVLYLANGQSQWQEPALILDSRFEVSVSGPIAQTRLTRTFRNTSEQWQEGVFVFPLPEDATVFGFALKVGERKIVGQLQPREKARETYQKARDNGQKAALVEQQRPNLFTNRVANIPPGEQVVVELDYQQPVAFRHGEFELRLPTTLTPRYMPGRPMSLDNPQWQSGWAMPTALVPDAASISPFTVRPEDVHPDSHRAAISVRIENGLPLAEVDSPSHRLDARIDGARAEVRPEAGEVLMDRDFVVRWKPTPSQKPAAAVFHQSWQGEDFLMAMVMPPEGVGPVLRRELVFVIDTSGSMAGESITQARSALLRGLDTLRPGDRFNVIQFNSQAHALFSQPVPAEANALARARQYVRGLSAEGGTEMAGALSLALGMGDAGDTSRVRQRVFITDGAVGNESALFDQIRQDLDNQRLFTVGIGSAPNLHFMREAARWGRGTYTAISSTAEVDQRLEHLFRAMEAPVLTNLRVDWPASAGTVESVPESPGDLFQGQPLIQTVRGVPASGELVLSGTLPGNRPWQTRLDLGQAAPATGLNRQWARGRIDGLTDSARLAGQAPDEVAIVELSLRHQVMSSFTSFVAVEEQPSRPAELGLARSDLPTLQPSGTTSGMLRYPQTATAAPLLIALGVVGLMFALALVLLHRRPAL